MHKINQNLKTKWQTLLPNFDKSYTQYKASSIYLEQTFVGRVDVQLIFENVGRNKRVYNKCKSEKDLHLV